MVDEFQLDVKKHCIFARKMVENERLAESGMAPFILDPELFYLMHFDWMVRKATIPNHIIESLRKIHHNASLSTTDITRMVQQFLNEDFVPIKLYIKEIGDYSDAKGIEKRVKKFLANRTEYGLVHLGVQVGPLIVDWNDGEIVSPRPFQSGRGHVICVLDMNNNKHGFTKEFFMKIARVCCEFNNRVKYNQFSLKMKNIECKSPSSNCHLFAKRLLKELDVEPWWKKGGPIDKFIHAIKHNGTQKGVEYDGLFITSANELNTVLEKRYPNGGKEDDETFQLLRGFDKALTMSGKQTTLSTTSLKVKDGEKLTEEQKQDITNAWRGKEQ